ncbi:MAG: EF-Tu/IF-2/RF-3 family GTPase [Candidatus Thermoplasmatota archaeon]|nr:EF-Tu/IF-2/RF-3 family GTPase [Candidatus Thermoplasmatota archaeon]
MNQITIGIFHDDAFAKELGKIATQSDMVFFHRKTDDAVYSFLYAFEDKIIPKSQIMNSIDVAIISAEQITSALGETILLLDSIGQKEGVFIIPPFSDPSPLRSMIKSTSLESFQIIEKNIHSINTYLEGMRIKRSYDEPVVITIDHFFHVKGVGEVVLGYVNQGILHKHDKLWLLPLKKEVVVRSIQMQDDDVNEAPAGSRVGLALKGVTVDELRRGFILCQPDIVETGSNLTLSFEKNRFYPPLSKGKFHATIGLQTVPITIADITNDTISVISEKPICFRRLQKVILLDLNADKLHHMGTGTIV